jgi:hypothetical protein
MYERPRGLGPREVGAFLHRGTALGDEITSDELKRARRTIGFGLLEANPRAEDGAYSQNAGHSEWTTENATIVGHRVDGSGLFVWEHRGVRSVRSIYGRLGTATEVVPLPPGVAIPLMTPPPDRHVVEATWAALGNDTQRARRIGRGVDWLMAAMRNSEIDLDTRLGDLQSGFDALLGDDDAASSAWDLRRALCALLDEPGCQTTHRTLTFRRGRDRQDQLSERGWWYHHFSELRNGIEHGYKVSSTEYEFDGKPHFNRAETELRYAILKMLAEESGSVTVAITDRFSRALSNALADAGVVISPGEEPSTE